MGRRMPRNQRSEYEADPWGLISMCVYATERTEL